LQAVYYLNTALVFISICAVNLRPLLLYPWI
jgi:hypothetical protein